MGNEIWASAGGGGGLRFGEQTLVETEQVVNFNSPLLSLLLSSIKQACNQAYFIAVNEVLLFSGS